MSLDTYHTPRRPSFPTGPSFADSSIPGWFDTDGDDEEPAEVPANYERTPPDRTVNAHNDGRHHDLPAPNCPLCITTTGHTTTTTNSTYRLTRRQEPNQ